MCEVDSGIGRTRCATRRCARPASDGDSGSAAELREREGRRTLAIRPVPAAESSDGDDLPGQPRRRLSRFGWRYPRRPIPARTAHTAMLSGVGRSNPRDTQRQREAAAGSGKLEGGSMKG